VKEAKNGSNNGISGERNMAKMAAKIENNGVISAMATSAS
jgi:hypothetical protein